jgi:tetratricopeptide (TPR) repeat protein
MSEGLPAAVPGGDDGERMSNWVLARRTAVMAASLLALTSCAATPPKPAAAAVTDPAPTSPLGNYLAALHAQREFDYPHAAAFIEKALAADPGNFALMRRAFLLRLSEGHVAEAASLARRLVDLDGNFGLPGLVLMTEDIKAGDFAGAVKQADAVPHDGAQRYAVPLLRAWSELGLHRPAPALQALDAMGPLNGLEPLKELHAALIADYADRVDEAEAGYKKLLSQSTPTTWRVVEVVGNFYERHGRAEAARRLYERFAQGSDPSLVAPGLQRIAKGVVPPRLVASPRAGAAEALFDLASLLDRRETADASLIFARLALDIEPKLALAQMLVGEIEEDHHHTAAALQHYQAVDSASPLSWSARLRAAQALDALGRTDEAAAQLKAMASERRDRPEPLVELGAVLRGRSRFADAVSAYDAAVARIAHPQSKDWRLFYSRGVALERSGQWPRAEADLKHALALSPDQPLALNYLGYSWIDKGENLSKALKMVERAVELRPDDGYIVDSLGWAFFRLGNFPRAAQLLERATELLPEDPTINDHLGDAYWRTGRLAEARYQWRRALQFKPDADEVKTIETKLDRGLGKPPATVSGG